MIDELYQAHRAAVLRVCSSILRNADDAADACQEVFLIAIESLDPAAKPPAARAWLLTVARNHCLDLLRRRKRLGKALVTLGPDDGRGTDMETAVADRDFVDIVFKQLSLGRGSMPSRPHHTSRSSSASSSWAGNGRVPARSRPPSGWRRSSPCR